MTESVDELAEFKAWKAERDERKRTNGAYCLTPEGREDVRRIFGNDPDSWVWALFTRVEELEAALASPDMEQRAGFVMVPPKDSEQLRLAVRAVKQTLFSGGSSVALPADSWIERAFIAGMLAAAPPIEALEGGKTDGLAAGQQQNGPEGPSLAR